MFGGVGGDKQRDLTASGEAALLGKTPVPVYAHGAKN